MDLDLPDLSGRVVVLMAMSHANCGHPRTPAARAACRKAGGSTPHPDALASSVVTSTETVEAARRIRATNPTPRTRKARTGDLKRPGTQLRTIGDLADVPTVFTPAIKSAWDRNWIVRVGDQFNESERRVELFGTWGVMSVVWKVANPNGVNGVFFRPSDSSITKRINGVNTALRLAAGEE